MKSKLSILVALWLLSWPLAAQVSVNADNGQPDPSAGLDVRFTDRGFLPPRMTHAEMLAIQVPASGLLVYCTDCAPGQTGVLCIFQAGEWKVTRTTCIPPLSPGSGTHGILSTSVVWNWNSVRWASGYKWNAQNNYATATDMGTALSKNEAGLVCNTTYSRYVWAYNNCGPSEPTTLTATTSSTAPASPVAAPHTATSSQIQWNWTVVPGATGYKWSTSNNYNTATDVGSNLFYLEAGLACNTGYTRYVWSYNACGHSAPTTLTFTTAPCGITCPSNVIDPRNGQSYGVVAIGTQCWMTSNMNVGIQIPGTVDQQNNMILEKYCYYDDAAMCAVYGGLYQWGEAVQYTNGASNNTNWNPPPAGHVQGICPTGWHVPTHPEWDILVNNLGGAAVAGGKLKEAGTVHWANPNTDATNISGFTGLPGGMRLPGGTFTELTFSGYFWTATPAAPTTAFARQLLFNTGAINTLTPEKVFGFSVRCLMNY